MIALQPRSIGELGRAATALHVDGRWVYWISLRGVYGGSDRLHRTNLDDGRSEEVVAKPGMIGGYAIHEGVFWTRQEVLGERVQPGAVMSSRTGALVRGGDPGEIVLANGVLYYADRTKVHRRDLAGGSRMLTTLATFASGLVVQGDRLYIATYGGDDVPGSIETMLISGGERQQLAEVDSPYLLAASAQRIAWAAGPELAIARSDGTITSRRAITSVQGLLVADDRVYWIDGPEGCPTCKLMMQIGDAEPRVLADLRDASDLARDDKHLYWSAGGKLWTLPL